MVNEARGDRLAKSALFSALFFVVSGIGLKNVYGFLRDEKGLEEPAWLKERMRQEDPNAVIGELGESGENELCARTLDIFAAAYGAECGNMALKILASRTGARAAIRWHSASAAGFV